MGRKNRNNKTRPTNPPVDPMEEDNAPQIDFEWQVQNEANLSEEDRETVDIWADRLSATVGDDYKTHIHQQLKSTAEQMESLCPEQIQKLLDFYTRHRNVATIAETWNTNVTGKKYKGLGFKVCSSTGKRLWGGDDGVYRANPELQEYLPRGCVIVKPEDGSAPALAIFGNRKFYGRSSGDDDESDLTSEAIRRGSYTKFLISNKANGESCHITLCPFNDNVWIIGSKNRKIAVSTRKDISLYTGQSFYGLSSEMAATFFDVLQTMGAQKTQELKNLLKFTRWTLNFEFEAPSHQHIVPLYKPQLVMIGCSGIHVPCGKASHPILGCSIARYFCFPTVLEDLKTYTKDELDKVCFDTARAWETEGSVLILLDDQNNVVDFVKVKSWWYILLRCIREKIRRIKGPESVPSTCAAVINRIQTLTRSMKIGEQYSRCFIRFGTLFVEWLAQTNPDGSMPRMINSIDLYPSLWNDFLDHNKLPKDQSLLEQLNGGSGSEENENEKYSRSALPLLILMQGIPGIGKSYLAKKLVEKMNAEGIKSKDIAQDDFVKDHGLKKSGQACLNYLRGTLIRREYRCIVLARNNSNPQQYSKYVDLDSEGLCRVIFVCPAELSTRLDEAVLLSVAGVLHRQSRSDESHPTDDMDACALASLPLKFFGSLMVHPSAFLIPVMKEEIIKVPNDEKFKTLLKRFQSKGFRAADVTTADLQTMKMGDQVNIAKYLESRREIGEITNQTFTFVSHVIGKNTPLPGSYFSVNLRSECSNRLIQYVESFFPEGKIPKDWSVSCDHVTMMHANSYFVSPKMVEIWEHIGRGVGTEITISPVSLLVNEKLAAMKVSCVITEKDVSINKYVVSKIPHITIACAPRIKAYMAAEELKQIDDSSLVDVSSEPRMYGTITLTEP